MNLKFDNFGQALITSEDLATALYKNPDIKLSDFVVEDPEQFNSSVLKLHAELDILKKYEAITSSIEEFDSNMQRVWLMPDEYLNLDIAEYILGLCKHEHELQRVGQELLEYQRRDLFNLLRYLKYLVDTFRKNNIVWGVGRGSSVSSYVLFLLGVHKIDSIYYQLPLDEFFKDV